MNEKGFREQIKIYRSITLEDIKTLLAMGDSFTTTIIKLTGASDAWACRICNYFSNNYSCENCIYDELNRKELLPEKVYKINSQFQDNPCHTESYDAIFEAKDAKKLLNSFRKRADYVEKCLNIYKKEIENVSGNNQ